MKTPGRSQKKYKSSAELDRRSESQSSVVENLRQSEDQFRVLVQGVKDCAIYLLSKDGVVTTWNPGAERIKGCKPEEIIGKNFACFYRPHEIQAGRPQRSLELAAANGEYEEENLRVRKDGSVFWANVLITALMIPRASCMALLKSSAILQSAKKLNRDFGRLNDWRY